MNKAAQRLVVMAAAGIFVMGTMLGIKLSFASPESVADEPACEIKKVARGEVLSSNLVMVHVYNSSRRTGAANRVKINLERKGFLGGVAKNNPGKVRTKNVTVLTTDPDDPRVRLVAAQFEGKVERVPADFEMEDGISILIGPKYEGLKKDSNTKIKAGRDVSVCVPAITLP
ncbi:LytR C-terminal domain-containing protein [Aeromicrobium duanguangcaii]|uniref:LytR C-terminal domain-containing protein n=1 Tax=Aeromicrobium duanguangcaii TaxID=2968086 RepID=A0ABY5KFQ9_9ACTN|nr:LytR C-terminal domain-containing protein [Aeromicrobium duanguangcaii]MCD9154268.1 LytR C-terminal domain-containing protein [Aeromicrobium duanguangcaii]UUI68664.1 LytR C-terminal domain-containing protein [Aeromicrobium duanguangcaii]